MEFINPWSNASFIHRSENIAWILTGHEYACIGLAVTSISSQKQNCSLYTQEVKLFEKLEWGLYISISYEIERTHAGSGEPRCHLPVKKLVIRIKVRNSQEAAWSPRFDFPQPQLNFPLATVSDAWHLCLFTTYLLEAAGYHRRFEQGVNPGNGGTGGLDQRAWPEQIIFKWRRAFLTRELETRKRWRYNLAGFLRYPAEERRVCISSNRVACGKGVAVDWT